MLIFLKKQMILILEVLTKLLFLAILIFKSRGLAETIWDITTLIEIDFEQYRTGSSRLLYSKQHI